MGRLAAFAAALGVVATPGLADPSKGDMTRVDETVGEMSVPMPEDGRTRLDIDNSLRFEPYQNFEEMFLRDDVVFLMRHGPTDWSKLDEKNVAPTDCENQRVLSEQGHEDMRDLGALLAHNDIRFGRIVVSEWCRNQQTVQELATGYEQLRPGIWGDIPVMTSEELNLLLSLQGAPNVTNLRQLISTWDGGQGEGPLLVVSHFTNIEELTQFSVYEGEILVVDPDRDNRVLGYLRLRSAKPDIGHFDTAKQAPSGKTEPIEAETPPPGTN